MQCFRSKYGQLTVEQARELNEAARWYCDHEVTIHFEDTEDCREFCDKLLAWKRLKEANIDYKLTREYDDFTETMHANVSFSFNSYPLVGKDLDLLFGGEE